MKDIYNKTIEEDITNEQDMFLLFGDKVDEINNLSDLVIYYLKHCRILFSLSILLWLFNQPMFIWLGTLIIWFITFIIASFKNAIRTEKIKEFDILKTFFYVKGILNKNNSENLKNFKIKQLWFEKNN